MKLAIVGSRGITDGDISTYIDEAVDLIITGGAVGVDTLAIEYAKKKRICVMEIVPDYKKYGKAAPIVRNRQIVNEADSVLVIWDGSSKGSKYVIDYCKKINKPCRVELKNKSSDSAGALH